MILKKSPIFTKLYSSTVASPSTSVSVSHPAYIELEKSFIEEYGITAVLFKHKKSGAEVMSVTADDNNKVFGVTFRTPPSGMYSSALFNFVNFVNFVILLLNLCSL